MVGESGHQGGWPGRNEQWSATEAEVDAVDVAADVARGQEPHGGGGHAIEQGERSADADPQACRPADPQGQVTVVQASA